MPQAGSRTRVVEPVVEVADQGDGLFLVAIVAQLLGAGERSFPVFTQGLHDGHAHQPLDVGAGRVVGAQAAAFVLVEGLFQQGAEDGRVHLAPVGPGGGQQLTDLLAAQLEDGGVLEETAVEVADAGVDDRAELGARLHLAPQLLQAVGEVGGVGDAALQQSAERAARQEVGILGEHREEAAHEEVGHILGIAAPPLQRLADLGQALGDLAGDAGRGLGGVQRMGIGPDRGEALAHALVAQVVHVDAEAVAIGKLVVGPAGAREVGEHLQPVSDVAGDDERRRGMIGVEQKDIALGLFPRILHHHVPTAAAAGTAQGFGLGGERQSLLVGDGVLGAGKPGLLGLQDEGVLLVEVDALGGGRVLAAARLHRALEDIVVPHRLAAGRIGPGHAQHVAELGQEHLIVGALRPALAGRPTLDELFDVHGDPPGGNLRGSCGGGQCNRDAEVEAWPSGAGCSAGGPPTP